MICGYFEMDDTEQNMHRQTICLQLRTIVILVALPPLEERDIGGGCR